MWWKFDNAFPHEAGWRREREKREKGRKERGKRGGREERKKREVKKGGIKEQVIKGSQDKGLPLPN